MSLTDQNQLLTDAVFNTEKLHFLQKGFGVLLKTWEEVSDMKAATHLTTEQALYKLRTATQENWNSIEEEFLKNNVHSFTEGHLEKDDADAPAKLILDLINVTNQVNQTIITTLESYDSSEKKLKGEILTLQEEIVTLKEQLMDVRWRDNQNQAMLHSKETAIERLETLNREKTDSIAQLKRDGNVQLWEIEKKRAIDNAKIKEEEYAERIKELEKERVALIDKANEMQGQMKMEKLKNELKLKPDPKAVATELDKLKKQNYLMEKDLVRLDRELQSYQKITIGLFSGLKVDFSSTFSAYKGQPSMTDETTIFQILRLEKLLEQFHHACETGSVSLLPASLPERYIGTNNDIKSPPVKKISQGYLGKTNALPIKTNFKTQSLDDVAAEDDDEEEDESSDDEVKRVIRKRKARKMSKDKLEHAVFVNPENDQVDMITVMKHFPKMTKDYVQEQWEQFRRYDTDGSLTLDLSEMMAAMMKTVGEKFTATEIREAMLEVDVDGSDDIDFFEYLSVANMLVNKNGKAAVFKSKMIQQQGNSVSKLCIVM